MNAKQIHAFQVNHERWDSEFNSFIICVSEHSFAVIGSNFATLKDLSAECNDSLFSP